MHIYYRIDYWSSPYVSGDKPPPINGFALRKIANDKVFLYGGDTAQGPSSELRVATVLGDSVVSAWALIYVGFHLFDLQFYIICQRMVGKLDKYLVHNAAIS